MLRKSQMAHLWAVLTLLFPAETAWSAAQVTLLGNWSAKQNAPAGAAGTPPSEAMLTFSRNGGAISGVMRAGRDEFPLFDVEDAEGGFSFTVVIPGTLSLSLRYAGTLNGNTLSLSSADDGQGRFALTAEREGPPVEASPSPAPATASADSKPAPQPPTPRASTPPRAPAPAPAAQRQASSAATQPTAPAVASPEPGAPPRPAAVGQAIQGSYITRLLDQLPPPSAQPAGPPPSSAPAPIMRGTPVPPATAAPIMQGRPVPPASTPTGVASLEASKPNPTLAQPPPPKPSFDLAGMWTAQQASPRSAAPVDVKLSFTEAHGSTRVGTEEWPLFDVQGSGDELSFSLVIPGTPYITIHYRGTVAADEMKLASLDEGQGVFTLSGHRASTPVPVAVKSAPPPVAAAAAAPA